MRFTCPRAVATLTLVMGPELAELVEHALRFLRHLDDEREQFGINGQREGEERAARGFPARQLDEVVKSPEGGVEFQLQPSG